MENLHENAPVLTLNTINTYFDFFATGKPKPTEKFLEEFPDGKITNKELLKTVVEDIGDLFEYASDELKQDADFILSLMNKRNSCGIVSVISGEVVFNNDIIFWQRVYQSSSFSGFDYDNLPETIKNNADFWMSIIPSFLKNQGDKLSILVAFLYMPNHLHHDFALNLIAMDGSFVNNIPSTLYHDDSFVWKVWRLPLSQTNDEARLSYLDDKMTCFIKNLLWGMLYIGIGAAFIFSAPLALLPIALSIIGVIMATIGVLQLGYQGVCLGQGFFSSQPEIKPIPDDVNVLAL